MASYSDIKNFINRLYETEMDTVDEVFNLFVNNPRFQNEYNIEQLYHILKHYMDTNIVKNDVVINIVTKFMEKYNRLTDLLQYLVFPYEYTGYLHERGHDDVKEFRSHDCSLYGLHKGDIIEIVANGNTIMVIQILENFECLESLTMSRSYCVKSSIITKHHGIKMSTIFGDISQLYTTYNHVLFKNMTPCGMAIMLDDLDTFQKYTTDNEGTKLMTSKCGFMPLDIMDGDIADNPIYFAILFNSFRCLNYMLINGYYDKPTDTGDYCVVMSQSVDILLRFMCENKIRNPENVYRHIIPIHNAGLFVFWHTQHELTDTMDLLINSIDCYNYNVFEYLLSYIGDEIVTNNGNREKILDNIVWLKLDHFEIFQRYFKWALTNFLDIDNSYVEYLFDHRKEYTNLVSEPYNILENLITNGNSGEVFDKVKCKLYPSGIPAHMVGVYILTCLSIPDHRYINVVDILEDIMMTNVYVDYTEKLNEYLNTHTLRYVDLQIVDLLLSKIGNIENVQYKKYIRKNVSYQDKDKVLDMLLVFINHGGKLYDIQYVVKKHYIDL